MIGLLAGVAFAIALGLLLVFFLTGDQRADRVSSLAFLAFYALATAVVYDIHQRYVDDAAAVWVATALAVSALLILFLTQALVLAGRVEFRRVGVIQTIGFAVYILWILAASVVVLAFGALPPELGWLGVVAVAVTLAVLVWVARDPAMVRGERSPSRVESLLMAGPFIAISAWLIFYGLSA